MFLDPLNSLTSNNFSHTFQATYIKQFGVFGPPQRPEPTLRAKLLPGLPVPPLRRPHAVGGGDGEHGQLQEQLRPAGPRAGEELPREPGTSQPAQRPQRGPEGAVRPHFQGHMEQERLVVFNCTTELVLIILCIY